MTNNKNIIRQKNIETLKKFMFSNGSAYKAEIAKETGISVVTTNSLVKELLQKNILIEGDLVQQPIGRPAFKYTFNYDLELFLLLSIQEKQSDGIKELVIFGKIVNLSGDIKYEKTFDFKPISMDFLISMIGYFLLQNKNISKIALSIPGKIYNGIILSSWNELFDNWNIAEELFKQTSIPIYIQNDAHLLTVGYTLLKKINTSDTIVGIFYPENSMPGITIFFNGSLLEGGHNLAGEAKFLPHLIDTTPAKTEEELVVNLIEILAIYNAVIAPDFFVISAGTGNKELITQKCITSPILSKQVNKPDLFFVENFQESLDIGLRWLATKETTYQF